MIVQGKNMGIQVGRQAVSLCSGHYDALYRWQMENRCALVFEK